MGWETRGPNGRDYYYRKSRRADGSVASTYAGNGPIAVAASEIDALMQTEKRWRRMAEGIVFADVDRADAAVREATAAVKAALSVELEARGYRYHRGEWRRPRRTRPNDTLEASQTCTGAASPAAGQEPTPTPPER